MQPFTFKMPWDFNLFHIGDDHEGTLMRDDLGWSTMVEMANSRYRGLPAKSNFICHHGDFIEAILVDDPRYDHYTTKKACVFAQMKQAKKNFKPLRKKLLWILDGNHTWKLRNFGNITQEFCETYLEMPHLYGTWSTHTTYLDPKGKVMFKHYATHGTKSINSTADDISRQVTNMKLILKRHLKNKWGDTLLNSKGHTHKLLVLPPQEQLYLRRDEENTTIQKYTYTKKTDGYIHPDFKWYVNTGAFYKLYEDGVSSYAEIAEYDPIQLGFAVALIRGGKLVDVVEEKI